MSGIEMRTLKLRDRLFFVRLTFTVRRWMKRDARVLLRSVNTSRADFLRLFGRLVTRPRARKLLPDWTAAGTPRRLVSRGFFVGTLRDTASRLEALPAMLQRARVNDETAPLTPSDR